MFLRSLNSEQKGLFYNLAMAAAAANHVIEESEKILLDAYADEMGIQAGNVEIIGMEEACARLKDISNIIELNQITFEILGMVTSDSCYDEEEKVFIGRMAFIFGIPTERIVEMFDCVNDYSALIRRINKIMFE